MASLRIDRLDAVLLVLGGIGLILFLALLPRGHPDAAGTFGIGSEASVEIAEQYFNARGFDAARLYPSARLARSPRLLDSLQAALGRRTAIVALQEGGRDRLPAFFWHVRWFEEEHPGFRMDPAQLEAWVLPDGQIWAAEIGPDVLPEITVDRDALGEVLSRHSTGLMDVHAGDVFTFDIAFPVEAADLQDPGQPGDVQVANGTTMLGPSAAVALASRHLQQTALADLPLEVSRIESLPARGPAAARVRFETTERVLGQTISAEVDVLAGGTLLGIRTRFNEVEERLNPPGTIVFEASQATYREALKYGGYILLVLFLLWVAVSRLSVRALDTRAALRDALVVAFFTTVSLALIAPSLPFEPSAGQIGWLVLLAIVVLFNAAILGLLAFITTAGGDALARDHDARPLQSLALARQTAWVNEPVGRALVRGAGLAMAVVGGVALVMTVFAESPMPSGDRFVSSNLTLSVFGSAAADNVWYAFVLTHAVFVGLGTVLHRWRAWLVVPGLAVVLAVLQVNVVDLPGGSEVVSWSLGLALGLGLAAVYVRTDALTILVAVVFTGLLWNTTEALLIAGSPAWPALGLSMILIVAVIGIGLRGLASNRTGDSLPRYEPDFVVEQRERARMQREFEIARDVQQSLLPRRMPAIPGLDIAARCVPAEEVGGDYYDLLRLDDNRLAVVIGDVSGKGIQAAFYMTLIKGYLQGLAAEVRGPAEMLGRINRLFRESAPRGAFVSMIYAIIDLEASTMSFARAGHTPLVIKRVDDPVRTLRPAGVAIGMAPQAVFQQSIAEDVIQLQAGDLIVLYTDGISEAMDRRREQFTDERLLETVSLALGTAEQSLDAVLDDVRAHVGPTAQFDDLTILAIRVSPGSRSQPSQDTIAHAVN